MNGALFIFDDVTALRRAIEVGGYSPRFTVADDGVVRWRESHRKAVADLASLQPGGDVYLFAERGIYGVGRLADPPVILNHPDALAPDPGEADGSLEGTGLPVHRFVIRFDEASSWFPAPVDMDDVLAVGADAMYALRTMEGVSFAVFDETEARAFESEVRLQSEGPPAQDAPQPPAGTPLDIPAFNVSCGADDELAMETDLVWRLNRGEAIESFDGSWRSAIRQFSASPPKPVRWIDRIDVLARRAEPSGRFIREHGVFELKTGRATKVHAEQLMRYVDWVVTQFHQGRYDRVRAYLVAEEFGPQLVNRLPQVGMRLFTTEPRRPRAKRWAALKLVTAERDTVSGAYHYAVQEDLEKLL